MKQYGSMPTIAHWNASVEFVPLTGSLSITAGSSVKLARDYQLPITVAHARLLSPRLNCADLLNQS